MTIQAKPKATSAAPSVSAEKAVVAFIDQAPDSGKTPRKKRGRKESISLTLAPDLLRQADEAAERMGQSRAAWISAAIYRALQQA